MIDASSTNRLTSREVILATLGNVEAVKHLLKTRPVFPNTISSSARPGTAKGKSVEPGPDSS